MLKIGLFFIFFNILKNICYTAVIIAFNRIYFGVFMNYAFVYPGQGSQTISMGIDFRNNFKIAEELVERASGALQVNMNSILMDDEEKLNKTEYTQPAIFLVSAMAHYILEQEFNIKPYVAFGHSLGEVSAYCLNGGASFEDSIILTHKRGCFMTQSCKDIEVGMMVCLGLNTGRLDEICIESRNKGLNVWAANYNVEGQVVLAGVKKDLELVSEYLKKAGAKRTLLLKMSVASHCPLLSNSIPPFRDLLQEKIKDSNINIISNVDSEIYRTKNEALDKLTKQLIMPVLYSENVLKAKELGVEKFIELGHGNVLSGLNKKISDIETISINSSESLKNIG